MDDILDETLILIARLSLVLAVGIFLVFLFGCDASKGSNFADGADAAQEAAESLGGAGGTCAEPEVVLGGSE